MEFKDKKLANYFEGVGKLPKYVPSELQKRLSNKLTLLESASTLDSLRVPPANRLEKLSGNYEGRYSIRVDKQYRLVFEWTIQGVNNVEFTDYH